jgi:hypothetical protein
VPADRRPPGAPARRRRRHAAADADLSPRPLERMWALVLRRFRDHVHSNNPTKDDDERT